MKNEKPKQPSAPEDPEDSNREMKPEPEEGKETSPDEKNSKLAPRSGQRPALLFKRKPPPSE